MRIAEGRGEGPADGALPPRRSIERVARRRLPMAGIVIRVAVGQPIVPDAGPLVEEPAVAAAGHREEAGHAEGSIARGPDRIGALPAAQAAGRVDRGQAPGGRGGRALLGDQPIADGEVREPERSKVSSAPAAVQTMGSPCRLNDVSM
jgi:hypothetical protein